jgi:hypothetical protein
LFDSVGKLVAWASLVAIATKRFSEQAVAAHSRHDVPVAEEHTTENLAGSGTPKGEKNNTQTNVGRAAKLLLPTGSNKSFAAIAAEANRGAVGLR